MIVEATVSTWASYVRSAARWSVAAEAAHGPPVCPTSAPPGPTLVLLAPYVNLTPGSTEPFSRNCPADRVAAQ